MSEEIKYYYSLKVRGLYHSDMQSVIDSEGLTASDLVEIPEKLYLDAMNPPIGKKTIFDDDGLRLEDTPTSERKKIAEDEKQFRIDEAIQNISIWQAKLLINRDLTELEVQSFNSWMDYIDKLQKIDPVDHENISWPEKPES